MTQSEHQLHANLFGMTSSFEDAAVPYHVQSAWLKIPTASKFVAQADY